MLEAVDKPESLRLRLRAVVVGSAGNLVEWFDFYCYSAFSLYFARAFFPAQDPTAQLLSTAGIFALGFFMRPLGGWLFGRIGDRWGRRQALLGSVALMCLGSALIAALPTYAQVGAWAPSLLLVARLVQGLSLGGEYGASATYLSETATGARRGLIASFQYVTLIGGQLLALLVLLALQQLLSAEDLRAWGWRLPFALGALLSAAALLARRHLPETENFRRVAAQPATGEPAAGDAADGSALAGVQPVRTHVAGTSPAGTLRELFRHPREALIVVGLTMGGTLAFYVYTTYMQKFLRLSAGLTDEQAAAVSAASLVFAMALQPLYGALSDRIGRRPMLIGFGVLGTLFTVPILSGIAGAHGPWEALALNAAAWLIVSGYTSINAVVKAELFPAAIRATGVGLPYALTVSVFGGSAEYIALWFKGAGRESDFYWYATAVIACTASVALAMREPRTHSRIDSELSAGSGTA
jgi:MHS family alpha-ketoglutarate permease-like MFS transporter